jgi:hypothetical protein
MKHEELKDVKATMMFKPSDDTHIRECFFYKRLPSIECLMCKRLIPPTPRLGIIGYG